MLMTEWDNDRYAEVRAKEAREDAHKHDALDALALGLPIESVQKITGLDKQIIA
jgi:hypothetical protein